MTTNKLLIVASIVSLTLYSCSTTEYATHINRGDMIKAKPVQNEIVQKEKMHTVPTSSPSDISSTQPKTELVEASTQSTSVLNQREVKNSTKRSVGNPATTKTKIEIKKEVRSAMKEFRKEQRLQAKQAPASDTTILLVILALFIPPLAVFLYDGIGTPFWISLILTLCFFVPGVIYSILHILDVI